MFFSISACMLTIQWYPRCTVNKSWWKWYTGAEIPALLHVRWCQTHRELHSGWILSTIQLSDRNTHRESKWVETESGLLLTSLTGAAIQIQVLKQNSTSGCGHKNLNPRTQCYLIINASHFNPSVAPFSIKIPWAQIIEHIAARNCFGWNQKR